MPGWQAIFEALGRHGIEVDRGSAPRPVGGGDISPAWQLATAGGRIFVKTAQADAFDMLDAEADGLRELRGAAAVRVPQVLCSGRSDADAFVALEWLDFGRPAADTAQALGRRLAAQHRCHSARFGWHRDNTIGSTPQINTPDEDWIRFFRTPRLEYQLELAAANGYTGELQEAGANLARRMDRLFNDYEPQPSLLHGDLWSGNWASVAGEPVTFDPAVHYGDRESDIAMTRLFGGFPGEFYEAYHETWPLNRTHRKRLPLYQLYHVLNHLNLFGGGYLGRALTLLRQIE